MSAMGRFWTLRRAQREMSGMGGKRTFRCYSLEMYEPWPEQDYPPFWRVALGLFLAPTAAAFAMACVMPAYDGLPSMAERIWKTAQIYAVFGAYPATLLLGLPAYFLLRRHFAANLISCCIAGAIIAALPWAIIGLLPSAATQASVAGRATVIDGVRTAYGWLLAFQSLLLVAAFGFIGGVVFWSVTVRNSRHRRVR